MSHHVGHCFSLAHLHNLCGALWLVAEVWKDLCWLEYSRKYSDETLEARERHLVFFLLETPLEILRGSFLLGFLTLELWLKTVCLTFVYLRAFKERWFVANIDLRGPGSKVYQTLILMVFENTLFVRLLT